MKKALDHITEQIQQYRKLEVLDGETLNIILQQITGTLFYLETERAKYHDKYQNKLNQLILEGSNVNKAVIVADVEIPELYMLRRIMESAYECVGAIRTNISWLKTEKHNTQ